MDNLIDQGIDQSGEVDVEMAVLALCMRKETAVIEVQNKLTVEDFTDERNSIIFGVILEMFFENLKIDRITVFAELERRGIADKVGGQRYVYRVGDSMAVMSGLESYIIALRDRSDKIKIIKAVEKIRKQATASELRADEVLDSAITSLTQLRRDGETTGLVPISEVLKSSIKSINADVRHGDTSRIKLGYPKLDAMLGGLGPGTIHILAARPGMGKTALAINMATNVAANQKTVVVFSLEMSNDEIGKRLLSSAMTKPVRDIVSSPSISESDRQQMDQALIKLRDYPIFFYDRTDINPSTMKGLIQQLVSSGHKPSLIFVDYLQLVKMKGLPGRSRNDEVAAISRDFKLLAKDLQIPIIALSQLSRDSAKRPDHTPQISDLRDSGAIEQDADTIMFVDRPGYYSKNEGASGNAAGAQNVTAVPVDSNGTISAEPAYIYLAKNRHGPMGKDSVWWIPSKTLFYEYNERDPEDPNNAYIKAAGGGAGGVAGNVAGNAAAQKYEFDDGSDSELEPASEDPELASELAVMDPPLSEDESLQTVEDTQEDDKFFADANDGYPEGFV